MWCEVLGGIKYVLSCSSKLELLSLKFKVSVITCTVMRAMQESSACMKFALAESSLHCPSDSECWAAGFHTCIFHAQLELECIARIQCSLSETSQVAWTRAHHAKNEPVQLQSVL